MDLDRAAVIRVFLAEAEERIARMEEALLALEGTPDYPGLLDGIFRDAHTIKGNAVSLGFAALGEVARTLEDLLQRLRGGSLAVSTPLTSRLLSGVDEMRAVLAGIAADGGEDDTEGP